MIKKLIAIFFIAFFPACSFSNLVIENKGNLKLKQVDYTDLPGWHKDDQNKAVISLVNSCDQFAKLPNNKQIGGKIYNITVSDFHDVCDIAQVVKGMNNIQARNFFENWFIPFEVSDERSGSKGLFTGYFIPELKGSKVKTAIYKYPVYARPIDLKNNKPYYTRRQIENGALKNKKLELLYVDDKVDLFFMHVQGSGRVILEDGKIVKLAYAGKNNLPYSSIGRHIIDNNILNQRDVSYFAIKDWMKGNPEKAEEIMNVNESFIFFQKSKNDYVYGAQGSPLMAERSLAVDTEIMPLGFPMWLNIRNSKNSYQKLVIAQDTGSAIKGVVRGDVFFGIGRAAEDKAARMNYQGKYYILVPANVIDKIS
jgi:membrane-bound lytic murein transglycosylase A